MDMTERYKKALDMCLTSGNHIAAQLIHRRGASFSDKYPPGTDHRIVMEAYRDVLDYDLWAAWDGIMQARKLVTGI